MLSEYVNGMMTQSAKTKSTAAMAIITTIVSVSEYLNPVSALAKSFLPRAAEHTGMSAEPTAWDTTSLMETNLQGML